MDRLANGLGLGGDGDLFNDPAERIERAYELQAAKVAYVRKGG